MVYGLLVNQFIKYALMAYSHRGLNMKASDIKQPKPKKIKGKKLDTMKELKKAFSKPTRVAEVGGRGYV
jgi:hypothetical protein